MIEKLYKYSLSDENIVERLIDTKNASIAHAIVKPQERFPIHNSNAIVHMIIVRGELSAKFNEQDVHCYDAGSILEIPYDTKMELSNEGKQSLEFFAIKAPSPTYK